MAGVLVIGTVFCWLGAENSNYGWRHLQSAGLQQSKVATAIEEDFLKVERETLRFSPFRLPIQVDSLTFLAAFATHAGCRTDISG